MEKVRRADDDDSDRVSWSENEDGNNRDGGSGDEIAGVFFIRLGHMVRFSSLQNTHNRERPTEKGSRPTVFRRTPTFPVKRER
ncbi:hypothetical protein HanRHA438_Chr11g0499231 [Helianthus annuus]|nr:hypothetical protein HanHA300_Chr11g0398751 [Helianthus annuus]KAJ0509007.1 hypothetical protein HanIR_Chr11g0523771 [Helianthus annuus]KAJ0517158.1 hypothetical protein HanHA89_Chr11g0422071 [Helianthus annuus]KAJ0685166.1 hypothetical protein HanLR1_Chr11g0399491 [Helianthus annuus]KAJ0689079.1 hypothetical protein HanOQP8_Chr11g0401541 [Helianthus annuus]